jgi:hypothetical protein
MRNETRPAQAIFWFTVFFLLVSICLSQSFWQRSYPFKIESIISAPDGDFLLGGTPPHQDDNYDFGLIRINPYGDTIWTKTYGGSGNEKFRSMFPSPDGNYFLNGITPGASSINKNDILLMKITPDGTMLWTNTFGLSDNDECVAIVPTPDGNFLVADDAVYNIDGNIGPSNLLFKIKPSGSIIRSRSYGLNDDYQLQSIVPTSDGNFLIAGTVFPGPFVSNRTNADIWLMKIDQNGDTLWTKTYGKEGTDVFVSIFPTQGGGFILACTIMSQGEPRSHKIWLITINSKGDSIGTRTYGREKYEYFKTVLPATDGYSLIGATTYARSGSVTYAYDIWLLKVNPSGDTLWTRTYGGKNDESIDTILATADGNFLLVGFTWTFGLNGDIWVVKVNPWGDTIWTKTFGDRPGDAFQSIARTSNGDFLLLGRTDPVDTLYGGTWLASIIDDRYAYKNQRFSFRIPVNGPDSLNFTYTPVCAPQGMTVSAGGTLTWTPAADSTYREHVIYVVGDQEGRNDTLNFYIVVNHDPTSKRYRNGSGIAAPLRISAVPSSKIVRFFFPSTITRVRIFDITGRVVGQPAPVVMRTGAYAVWPAGGNNVAPGRYFASVSDGKTNRVIPFLYIR